MKKPDYLWLLSHGIRFLGAFFGNPAVPGGPVAFRPTIARGLALRFLLVLARDLANRMPILIFLILSFNPSIIKGSLMSQTATFTSFWDYIHG
jgi:hypothetical protein